MLQSEALELPASLAKRVLCAPGPCASAFRIHLLPVVTVTLL